LAAAFYILFANRQYFPETKSHSLGGQKLKVFKSIGGVSGAIVNVQVGCATSISNTSKKIVVKELRPAPLPPPLSLPSGGTLLFQG